MKQYRLQKRQHPIFSPVAIVSTLLLVCGLLGGVYLTGGRAFSPGDLSAINHGDIMIGGFFTHTDFGDDCSQCHTPFQGVEAGRCEKCHENVGRQRQTGAGLHSRFELGEACARCHLEHRGNNFDLIVASLVHFDHEVTEFSLAKHALDYTGASLDCTACHLNENDFTPFIKTCADCHREANAEFMTTHTEAYGETCLDCHDGHDTLAGFTIEAHAEAFALTGVHANTPCEDCHAGGRFEYLPQECLACHAEPEPHMGLFGTDCIACHTADGWLPATLDDRPFDHAQATGFSLTKHITGYDGKMFTCRSCHNAGQSLEFADSQCVDCHTPADPTFMHDHMALFGEDCLSCHEGTGNMTNFDHALVWPLAGQHALIECTACHVDHVFRDTPDECVACHAEPEVHTGLFGPDCIACHTAQAWLPARLTQHTFPLDHGDEGEVACATCHPSTYTEYSCYGCHEHNPAETEQKHLEEGISRPELPNCVQCHPTGREHEAEEKDDD